MSQYTSTQWTCDRCGQRTIVGSHETPEQPFGWGALWLVRPPLMAPADSDQRPDQVCPDCINAYFGWFTAGAKAATT